jgi:hypothetical protein
MVMVTLSLTEQEAAVLQQLIDAAVRAQGLKVAEAGLYLNMKIVKAMEMAKSEEPPSPPMPKASSHTT